MASDIVYCGQCGGASPRGSVACRFCGARLPPAPAPPPVPPAVPVAGRPPGDDDPWAELHEPGPAAAAPDAGLADQSWGDPSGVAWRGEPEPGLPPTQLGAWQADTSVPPVYGAPPATSDPAPGDGDPGEPTLVGEQWGAPLIEPGADGPRRGLPGWAWVATVVVLGTLLGVGAYVIVDRADDDDGDSVRTEQTTTTSSSTSTSTSTSTTTSTTSTTVARTTVPVVPATPPATPPVTGPPTVPGAVTSPTTVPPTTVPTTPPPTTAAPTTPAPTTAPPTTPAPTTAPPTTPPPTAPPSGAVPGDLGIPGVPMSQPACDGRYVTFLASVKDTTASAMQQALESFPGSHYLRTDQTCASLNAPSSDGSPLYRIFVGPYADVAEACTARSQGSQGSFVKRLSDTDPPAHVVACE